MLDAYRSLLTATDLPDAVCSWLDSLPSAIEAALTAHGEFTTWSEAVAALHAGVARSRDFTADCVRIGSADDLTTEQRTTFAERLMVLHPWRKGPFCLHGIHLDTEWRSDWKWRRVAPHLSPLAGRLVLDVGCGNGYYGWRMLGAGARRVIGLDPTIVFVMQWQAIRRLAGDDWPLHVIPLGSDALKSDLEGFDTTFSMGVLYHRRDPIEHLQQLRGTLRQGGELVLETLVIEGEPGKVLVPEGRYAKMRNVWNIPSVPTLEGWLRESGFRRVRTVDVTPTTIEEQRSTAWMRFHSLADYLDPDDPSRTVEGYPAPIRAVVVAER